MEREQGGLFSHDPAIFYDDNSGYFYTYSTDAGPRFREGIGGQIRRSKDLINFEFVGNALKDGVIPREVFAHTKASGVWAPDIIKYGNEYRLYYTASSFGSKYSAIGLAVADNPEGPFEHKGIVIKSTKESPVNAIDANIVTEEGTGEHYLVYGSFWGGIRILKLDKSTGFAAEEGYGISIARRSTLANTAIEGPYIRYNKETGYYYLFVSYDSLSDMYNVRVGRSRCITGPYLDHNGNDMTNTVLPPNHVGLKLTTGYSFKPGKGFLALGHNSVLKHGDEWFMVCHARYEDDHRRHTLNIRKMLFDDFGWPVVSPALYSGEKLMEISEGDARRIITGSYQRIDFVDDAREFCEKPSMMELLEDGTARMPAVRGRWEYDRMKSVVTVTYNGVMEKYFLLPAKDREEGGDTYVLTGRNMSGNGIWCKKIAMKKEEDSLE